MLGKHSVNSGTCRMIRDAAASMQKLVQSGKSPMEAWNDSTVMLTWAAIVSRNSDAFKCSRTQSWMIYINIYKNILSFIKNCCKICDCLKLAILICLIIPVVECQSSWVGCLVIAGTRTSLTSLTYICYIHVHVTELFVYSSQAGLSHFWQWRLFFKNGQKKNNIGESQFSGIYCMKIRIA